MALFNRKKSNNKAVPPEVKQYYASEHRERVGLAWLIAFLSLIVTVAVVAGLFFGGRWAYRKVANKDTNNKPTTGAGVDNVPDSQSNPDAASKPNDLQPTAKPPTDGGEVAVDDNKKPESDSSSSESSSGDNSSDESTKATEPAPTALSDTGPGSTLAVFVAVSILAYVAHWQYQKRRALNN